MNVQLQFPVGEYDIFFVLNNSDDELILAPDIAKASDVYISNNFSNKDAEIYGYSRVLEVTGNMSINIVLQRMYSQVKVEFTDIDLSTMKSISVNQVHEPFFYSPFTTGMANPILDQTEIKIDEDFQANKQIVFNQFMGILSESIPVKYSITVQGESEVIRSFEINSAMKNNIQLVFRGELLEGATNNVAFQITKNETWDGENEVSF